MRAEFVRDRSTFARVNVHIRTHTETLYAYYFVYIGNSSA